MTVNQIKHQAKLAEWKEKILDCRATGKSVTSWCAQHGYHRTTYYKWEREIFGLLAAANEEQLLDCTSPVIPIEQPELVELPIVSSAPSQTERTMDDFHPVAVVHVGKYELKLSNLVSPELMRQLKGLVEGAD